MVIHVNEISGIFYQVKMLPVLTLKTIYVSIERVCLRELAGGEKF